MSFKERLRQARKHAGLTQQQLAEKVGMTQPSITDLERGKSQSTTMTAELAHACGVNALWLASGEGGMLDVQITSTPLPQELILLLHLHETQSLTPDDWIAIQGLAALLARKNRTIS